MRAILNDDPVFKEILRSLGEMQSGRMFESLISRTD